jgi:hypothetical protein
MYDVTFVLKNASTLWGIHDVTDAKLYLYRITNSAILK